MHHLGCSPFPGCQWQMMVKKSGSPTKKSRKKNPGGHHYCEGGIFQYTVSPNKKAKRLNMAKPQKNASFLKPFHAFFFNWLPTKGTKIIGQALHIALLRFSCWFLSLHDVSCCYERTRQPKVDPGVSRSSPFCPIKKSTLEVIVKPPFFNRLVWFTS